MTQKEFTDRTGIATTPEEFARIHSIYMNTVLDKDDFCKDWKKHTASQIIDSMHVVSVSHELEITKLRSERDELVNLLITEAHYNMSASLKNKAIAMVGHTEVISRMFELGIELWPGDKDYIINNLPKTRI